MPYVMSHSLIGQSTCARAVLPVDGEYYAITSRYA